MRLFLKEIVDRTAVTRNKAFELPICAQDPAEQQIAAAGWLSINGVIGAHNGTHPRLHDRLAECWQIRLPKVMRRKVHVESVTITLRSGVNGKVLGRCDDAIVSRVGTLQPAHELIL